MLERLERIPFPQQLDRVILLSGVVAGAVLTPILAVLLVLLVINEITAPELIFWLLAALIVIGALGAVLLPNVVHATLSLVVTMLGVAGIFLLIGSEFLALVQILLYGGGVTILLLFGLMLTNASDDPIVTDGAQKPFAAILGVTLAALIGGSLLDHDWLNPEAATVAFGDVGNRLFRDYGLPFEVASLVLLVALIGAIAIARRDQPEDEDESVEAAS